MNNFLFGIQVVKAKYLLRHPTDDTSSIDKLVQARKAFEGLFSQASEEAPTQVNHNNNNNIYHIQQ